MNGQTVQRKVVIVNPEGLHVRPAAAFVERARQFQSTIQVRKDDKCVDGKRSPLELFLLVAEQGSELTVEATGPDAVEALRAVVDVLISLDVVAAESAPHPPATG
jgi:phosphotransferase system HPr (HPr) family protein